MESSKTKEFFQEARKNPELDEKLLKLQEILIKLILHFRLFDGFKVSQETQNWIKTNAKEVFAQIEQKEPSRAGNRDMTPLWVRVKIII